MRGGCNATPSFLKPSIAHGVARSPPTKNERKEGLLTIEDGDDSDSDDDDGNGGGGDDSNADDGGIGGIMGAAPVVIRSGVLSSHC